MYIPTCNLTFYQFSLNLWFNTSCTKLNYLQIYILYETYDCVLQYVQISAYSHNFQTNNNFKV